MDPIGFDCTERDAGQRLDQVLVAHVPGMSRARAKELAAAGKVRVNGRRCRKGSRVREGDRVELEEAPRPADFVPTPDPEVRLRVVFEDDDVVVIDKDAGTDCHPLRPEERGTVVQGLLARYPELAGVGYGRRESGLVHRLDRDTSGLLLVARNAATFEGLREQLRGGSVDKRYLALCAGEVRAPRLIDLPIAHHPTDGRRVVACMDEKEIARLGARPAVTEVLRATPRDELTLVEVRARTARRHQVRAHLAAIGHALAGDALYGGPALPGLDRHFLHASSLRFVHPRTGAPVHVEAPLPADLQALLDRLSAGAS